MVNPRLSEFWGWVFFFFAKVHCLDFSWNHPGVNISMPSMLIRLFDAILDAECHTEQETANFMRLGMGNSEWPGWLMLGIYILMVWLMAMAMVVGTISSIPQVCSHKITKPLWGCSCLALSSTCMKGSHFFPGKNGTGWRDECRDDWLGKRAFFPERNLKREPDLYITYAYVTHFFLMINPEGQEFLRPGMI